MDDSMLKENIWFDQCIKRLIIEIWIYFYIGMMQELWIYVEHMVFLWMNSWFYFVAWNVGDLHLCTYIYASQESKDKDIKGLGMEVVIYGKELDQVYMEVCI